MDLAEFQTFVRERPEYFEGVHPETSASLEAAEKRLGCRLPDSLKWLLSEWGYSRSCGIEALDEAVEFTLECRTLFQVPAHYVILNDWGDGGVVYLDTRSGAVHWGDGGDVQELATKGQRSHTGDVFEDYPAWVVSRQKVAELPPE